MSAPNLLLRSLGLSLAVLLVGGCPDKTACPECGFGSVDYTVPSDCEIGPEDMVTAELGYEVDYSEDNCPEEFEDTCETRGTESIPDPVGAGERDTIRMPVQTAPDSTVRVTVTYTITGPGQPDGMTVKEVSSDYVAP